LIVILRFFFKNPEPLQSGQGFLITLPDPLQLEQVWVVENMPKAVLWVT
jgi:hypothetical protein